MLSSIGKNLHGKNVRGLSIKTSHKDIANLRIWRIYVDIQSRYCGGSDWACDKHRHWHSLLAKETLCQGLKHKFKESNCPHIERIHSLVSFSSHFQSRSPRSESFTVERRAPTRAKGMRYYSKFEVKIAEQSILAPPVHSCQRSLGKHQPRAVSKPPWVADNS